VLGAVLGALHVLGSLLSVLQGTLVGESDYLWVITRFLPMATFASPLLEEHAVDNFKALEMARNNQAYVRW
jgi:uncharacterized membrane protein required for colicin V production